MAMEFYYELGAGMGGVFGLNFMGEMYPQHVQNNLPRKGKNYVEGGELGRLPFHLCKQAFHGYGREVLR